MNADENAMCLKMLRAYWPNPEWDEARCLVWGAELRPLDFTAASQAIQQLGRTSKWAPSVADFLTTVKGNDDDRMVRDGKVWVPGTGWCDDLTGRGGYTDDQIEEYREACRPAELGPMRAVDDVDGVRRLRLVMPS